MDRKSIVEAFHPVLHGWDPYSPLTLGNGDFAFTADLTGLQTFDEDYECGIPLLTMASWGWHTAPFREDQKQVDPQIIERTGYSNGKRMVPYTTQPGERPDEFSWLRQNPHKFHLGRLSFMYQDRAIQKEKIEDPLQELKLWDGALSSSFKYDGEEVHMYSSVHPSLDMLSIMLHSPLVKKGLVIALDFPAPSPERTGADWNASETHQSVLSRCSNHQYEILRMLDDDRYFVTLRCSDNAQVIQTGAHHFEIVSHSESLELQVLFSPRPASMEIPSVLQAVQMTGSFWNRFWNEGGFVSIEASDPRANELMRRIILSQYLTAINCAGSEPPAETGLTMNSWYGKFHLEMHYWHAAHFALWNRPQLLQKSLWYYHSILPQAEKLASSQGYAGARWPKMTCENGIDSPSNIGPLLIWQQPHPIYYAELLYRVSSGAETLDCYRDIVLKTAEFMADYAVFDEERGVYCLGPGMIPSQENHDPAIAKNPPYELEYWRWGLRTANRWLARLGEKPNEKWDEIAAHLAPAPHKNGMYLAHEACPDTYTPAFNFDHPSMTAALGMLPGDSIDPVLMENSLRCILNGGWQMDGCWGWDFPMLAMCAARLGLPDLAIDALLYPSAKNVYLPNGHNRQADRSSLPLYLPGNGGLLLAVALMCAGWDGNKQSNPGFPASWKVEWEDLAPLP